MSADARITIPWADGEHTFRLPIAQLRELQDKCTSPRDKIVSGPLSILDRLTDGSWRLDDIRETIRLGLIGGGMKPGEAYTLVTRYVDGFPLADSVLLARAILSAAVVGVPEDPVGQPGKDPGEEMTPDSSSPNSTGPEQ